MVADWLAEHRLLSAAGVTIAPGLTDLELEDAEAVLGAAMPPDLRHFLALGLPHGERFPNWREPHSASVQDQLNWPFEGIAFDVSRNGFWFEAWGPRPEGQADAVAAARAFIARAPRLIPVFAHRYIPADPCEAGNPVFSVYQTEVICYGVDLANYLRCEFSPSAIDAAAWHEPRRIPFWSEIAQ